MGKIFSKPVPSTAPIFVPLNPEEGTANPDGLSPPTFARSPIARHQVIPTGNIRQAPIRMASRYDISPSIDFRATDQDASTVIDSGASPMSLSQARRPRGSAIDTEFSWIHPETGKVVFRRATFGEKRAVQILAEDLLEMLHEATAKSQGSHDKTIFSSTDWIMEPYELIIRNKAKIERQPSLRRDTSAKHFAMLLEFLELEQPGAWQKYNEVLSGDCRQILFNHLWLIYPPRSTAFKIDGGAWRAYVVERSETIVESGKTSLRIYAWFLDFDRTGDSLIPHQASFEVSSFSSERRISMLELIPEWVSPREEFLQDLIDRGKEHWSYRGRPRHMEYRGDAWPQAPCNVIIDYSTSTKCPDSDDLASIHASTSCCSVCIGESLGLFSYPRRPRIDDHVCVSSVLQTPIHSINPFQEEDLSPEGDDLSFLFCPPKLWAFSLRFKTWKLISHDQLDQVEQGTAFEDELYMPNVNWKNSLDQIVSAYRKDSFFRRPNSEGQKGRGLNILLVGSSGTGKTFTAECLSQKFEVPLYTVNCGDLGLQSDKLDEKLLETFTRASNWNAMVLLDDVDIYGYDREGYMYKRSALLPTFLRHLEHSDCLTFISMASVDKADPAFSSRIHITIPFPKFDYNSQRDLWRRFIERLDPSSTRRELLLDFVEHDLWTFDKGRHTRMNAWQIRNCVDNAMMLAQNEGFGGAGFNLQPQHIRTVLELNGGVMADILRDEDDLAPLGLSNPFKSSANPFAD